MLNKTAIISICMASIVLSCVSKNEFVELETELNHSQAQLAADNKKLSVLQARNNVLLNENGRLIETIEGLRLELQQEKVAVKQKEREISEIEKTRKEIESSLKEQIAQKDVKLEEIEGKLKVTFVDKILFDSGSANVKPKGKEVLLRLAESFREHWDQSIVVEGHTDDVEIGSALRNRFPTNWELSAARSTAVTRFLQEKGNIEPERLTASGFSFYRPVASNETEEGRMQNRRIEIILLPKR